MFLDIKLLSLPSKVNNVLWHVAAIISAIVEGIVDCQQDAM
jgi:hypothetical protein